MSSATETIDERIVRLRCELAEARAEKRRQGIAADLTQDPGMVVRPRAKPGPKPNPNRPMVIPPGTVKRTARATWRFRVALGGQLILGPERDTAGESADDLAKWRQDEIARRGAPTKSTWSPSDADGRQTCLQCEGEGEVVQGRGPCLACNGDGYRWV